MPRFRAVTLLPGALLLLMSSFAPNRAQALDCRSANGSTVCTESESLSCQTVNDRTICTHGPNMSCETIGGRTVCHGDGAGQTLSIEENGGELSIHDGTIDLQIH